MAALYTYLAVCDFMVNLWKPLTVANNLLMRLRPEDHDADNNEIVR